MWKWAQAEPSGQEGGRGSFEGNLDVPAGVGRGVSLKKMLPHVFFYVISAFIYFYSHASRVAPLSAGPPHPRPLPETLEVVSTIVSFLLHSTVLVVVVVAQSG